MKGKIAILGNSDNVSVFSACGVKTFMAKDKESATETLKKIAKEYSVIFITESLSEEIKETVEKYNNVPYPIILPIPQNESEGKYGEEFLKKMMNKALGVDILFNEK